MLSDHVSQALGLAPGLAANGPVLTGLGGHGEVQRSIAVPSHVCPCDPGRTRGHKRNKRDGMDASLWEAGTAMEVFLPWDRDI